MITVSLKTARQALTGLRVLKPWKQKHPALQNVRVGVTGEDLVFEATTLDESLRFHARPEQPGEGTVLVPYALLQDAIQAADDGVLELGPESLTYVAAGARLTVPFVPTGDPLPPSPQPEGPEFALSPAALTAITEAQASASRDSSRYILNAVHVSADAVVATDGRQLYRHEGLGLAIPDPGITLPLSLVPGLWDLEQPAVLRIWDQQTPKAEIRQGPWSWITKLVVGNYPNTSRVVPRLESYVTAVALHDTDAERLCTVLPRLPGYRDDNSPILLSIGPDGVSLCPPANRPQVRVALDRSSASGPACTVKFNAQYLLTGLKLGLRELRVRDDRSPVLMRSEHRLQLWMPLRPDSLSVPAPEPVAEPQPEPQPNTTMVAPVSRIETAPPATAEPVAEPVGDATQHVQRARELLRELHTTLGQLLVSTRDAARQHRAVERDYEALKRNLRVLKAVEV